MCGNLPGLVALIILNSGISMMFSGSVIAFIDSDDYEAHFTLPTSSESLGEDLMLMQSNVK